MKSVVALIVAIQIVMQITFTERCFAQRTEPYQHLWEVDAGLGDIWKEAEDPLPPPINVERLAANELAVQVKAAQEICLMRNRGAVLQPERAIELLTAALKRDSQPLQARRAFASALLILCDASQADFLWQLAQTDPLLRSRVEQKLIEWKSPLALEAWRTRLGDPRANSKEIASAMAGLAAVGGAEDNELLVRVLRGNATTAANRIVAADVLGRLNASGLNELAREVLASRVEQSHLLAAHLLKRHTSESSLVHLRAAFEGGDSAAQNVAAHAMSANFREAAHEYAPQLIEHQDPALRALAATDLQTWDDEPSLRLQAKLLNDPLKSNRRFVGKQLLSKANSGQRGIVDECLTEHLSADSWFGLEQAIILAVQLNDRSRCSRFIELIEHPRPEVSMCAAWGLMELAEEPEHFEAMIVHVDKLAKRLAVDGVALPITLTDLIRISYLNEAFGRKRYEPALDVLMQFVPKNNHKLGHVSRASAVWSLGKLHKGKDDASFRAKLCERLLDNPIINPEDYLVRVNSALALGEMAYEDCAYALKKFDDSPTSPLGVACLWALDEIEKKSAPN